MVDDKALQERTRAWCGEQRRVSYVQLGPLRQAVRGVRRHRGEAAAERP
ncbi:hypothetical protein [Nonomuraea diastatica]|nr:hypothetical protein [Nonomuraea diastatica]